MRGSKYLNMVQRAVPSHTYITFLILIIYGRSICFLKLFMADRYYIQFSVARLKTVLPIFFLSIPSMHTVNIYRPCNEAEKNISGIMSYGIHWNANVLTTNIVKGACMYRNSIQNEI